MTVSDHLKSIVRARWASAPPSDWTYHRIGDVLEKRARGVDVQDSVLYTQPVIRRGHGGVEVRERQYGRDILTKRQYRLQADDWLMSKVQILHKAYGIVPDELDGAIASGSYYAFEPSEQLDLRYLWYLSHHPAFHESCALASVGVVIEKMVFRVKDWLDFHILLPPLKQQQKIAAILSSVDDAIAATRKVIQQTKRVKKGLLQTLMTRGIGHTRFKETEIGDIPEEWPLCPIDDVCQKISVGIVVRPASLYVEDGVPCIRSANISVDGIVDQDWVFISEEASKDHAKSILRSGDVIVVRTGEPGTACVVPEWLDSCNCVDIIFARPLHDRLDPHFLAWFLNSHTGRKQVLQRRGGLAQKHLNVGALKRMLVPIPPIEEQRTIVERVAGPGNVQSTLVDEVSRLEALRRGLMQDLLTGRVRVQLD